MDAHSTSYFSTFHDDCLAAAHEFVGTVVFLLLGLGGIQAAVAESESGTTPSSSVELILYVSTSMGISLLVSAWLFFRVTGGLFNPNVSLALLLVGVIGPVRFVLYCIAQLLGGIAAAALILALTPGPLAFKYSFITVFRGQFAHSRFISTYLHNGVNAAQGVFIEMFITSALVLAVLMLAAEKHRATPFAPVSLFTTIIRRLLTNVSSW
jgi:aquaporin related protein